MTLWGGTDVGARCGGLAQRRDRGGEREGRALRQALNDKAAVYRSRELYEICTWTFIMDARYGSAKTRVGGRSRIGSDR